MFHPWFSVMMLLFEASEVVALRIRRRRRGGADAWDEAHLMVSETITAGLEAVNGLMTGSNSLAIVDRYREHVAADAHRLAATQCRAVGEQELVRILQERTGILPTAHRRSP
jgi:hypothetical protein